MLDFHFVLKDKLENVVLNRADHIITINKYLKNSVVGILNGNSKNIHVLYNSVDTDIFSFSVTVRNKVRGRLGVSKSLNNAMFLVSLLLFRSFNFRTKAVFSSLDKVAIIE